MEEVGDPYDLIDDDGEDETMFVAEAVDKREALDREFCEMLYILATGGAPPREIEMASLKYMNTQHGPRNTSFLGGQVILVTEYNKRDSVKVLKDIQ